MGWNLLVIFSLHLAWRVAYLERRGVFCESLYFCALQALIVLCCSSFLLRLAGLVCCSRCRIFLRLYGLLTSFLMRKRGGYGKGRAEYQCECLYVGSFFEGQLRGERTYITCWLA
ncbi:hypothetical protein F5144DRAFT_561585 [Chaetomium tenue]|uniref:Uncharacterized protein n=1 Tax=Chaetomium tenue TaxID=1854479 RepID=A0ACB7PG50_9PEZI|nr:hypothetical protein F5144DRAFT_561585 [Chaetomium globosum]